MVNLDFKNLTKENWLQPDQISYSFLKLSMVDGRVSPATGEDWISLFLRPTLSESVPANVRALFDVARGSLAYGYFFYPLYALAGEQLFRVAEAAITAKCEQIEASHSLYNFNSKLRHLRKRKIISEQEFSQWNDLRKMRNEASHPKDQTILPPGPVSIILESIAERINTLFA